MSQNFINLPNSQPRVTRTKLEFSQTSPVQCDCCSNSIFVPGFFMRKVSALLTETGQDSYVQIPTFYCTSCGHSNLEFIPTEVREELKTIK